MCFLNYAVLKKKKKEKKKKSLDKYSIQLKAINTSFIEDPIGDTSVLW